MSYDEDTGVYVVKLIVSIQDSATEEQDIHQQISEALHTEVKPYSYSSGSTVPKPQPYLVYDQLGYIVDTLNGDHPNRSPNS